jgi:hypothetical protein
MGCHYDLILHLNINSFRGPGDLTVHDGSHSEGTLLLAVVSDPTLSCKFCNWDFILVISQVMNESVSRSITCSRYKNLPCEFPTLQNRFYALACVGKSLIYVVCLKSSVNGTRKQSKQTIQTN